ncbi:hypothetical protein V8E54_006167 [Elaphomyces granulatus]
MDSLATKGPPRMRFQLPNIYVIFATTRSFQRIVNGRGFSLDSTLFTKHLVHTYQSSPASLIIQMSGLKILGIVKAEIYKLMLHEEGAFLPHQDSEKADEIFGITNTGAELSFARLKGAESQKTEMDSVDDYDRLGPNLLISGFICIIGCTPFPKQNGHF